MSGIQQNSSGATSRSSDLEPKCCVVLHRWVFCSLAFLAVFISSLMLHLPNLLEDSKIVPVKNPNGSGFCPAKTTNYTQRVWVLKDPATKYITVYAIHWGYLASCLPGAILSDQFGGKYLVTLSLLFSSFWCLINPAIAVLSRKRPGWMAGTRFFRGFFKGFAFPAIMSLLVRWAPDTERTSMTCLVYGSFLLAHEISSVIQRIITKEEAYFVFGSVGVVFCLLWHLFVYPSPYEHPWIKPSELKFFDENTEDKPVKGRKKIPWGQMFTSSPLWAILFLQVGQAWTWFVFIYAYEVYMPGVLKFENYDNTVWWTPFYLFFGLTIIFGFTSDWFIKGKHFSVTTMRKINAVVGNVGAGGSCMFAIFRGCNSNGVMLHFTIGLCFEALLYSSCRVNHLDLTSNFVGTLMGITRSSNQIIEYVIRARLPQFLTAESSLPHWAMLFWLTFGINLLSTFFFVVFGSGLRQEWNRVQ